MWALYHIDVFSRHIVILSSPDWELGKLHTVMADDVIV